MLNRSLSCPHLGLCKEKNRGVAIIAVHGEIF